MSYTTRVNRADLLRCLKEANSWNNEDSMAQLMGYVKLSDKKKSIELDQQENSIDNLGIETKEKSSEIDTTIENPPYAGEHLIQVARLLEYEKLEDKMIQEGGVAATRLEDLYEKTLKDSPVPELLSWSKMVVFLKNTLGVDISSSRIDQRKLLKKASTGLPITSIPYRPRLTWSAQALLLVDVSREMWPSLDDPKNIISALKKERGSSGLTVLETNGAPSHSKVANLPSGAPVIAFSAMGQLAKNSSITEKWNTLASYLRRKGHPLYVLSTCSPSLWNGDIVKHWNYVAWDTSYKLPHRNQIIRNYPRKEDEDNEDLLIWLSTASYISRALLRSVRLAMSGMSAVSEYSSWFDDSEQVSKNALILSNERQVELQQKRNDLVEKNPELAQKVAKLIADEHANYSPALADMVTLREHFHGLGDLASLEKVKLNLQKMVQKMREVVVNPAGSLSHLSGIPAFFNSTVSKLSPEILGNPIVSTELAQGLGLSMAYARTAKVQWVEGIDVNTASHEMEKAGLRKTQQILDYSVRIAAGDIQLWPDSHKKPYGYELGKFKSPFSSVRVNQPGKQKSILIRSEKEVIKVNSMISNSLITLESRFEKLSFSLTTRKQFPWASAMGYDTYGLWAEFKVDSIIFKLRWIPPGRFKMGSPESEEGRSEDEGPQQEVVITDGYWMASTQTTQEQWQVVMEKNPSHFKEEDKKKHPVESVSWDEVQDYLVELNTLVEGLELSLPSEAEWEYACRAKNESSYNQDEELKDLGWYGEGSKGKTHAVGQKLANNWGLYDMHGNVWEWCMDDKRDYSIEPIENPIGSMGSALRMLRGGCCWDVAGGCRSASRGWYHRDDRDRIFGFRLAARSGKQVSRTRSKVSGSEQ